MGKNRALFIDRHSEARPCWFTRWFVEQEMHLQESLKQGHEWLFVYRWFIQHATAIYKKRIARDERQTEAVPARKATGTLKRPVSKSVGTSGFAGDTTCSSRPLTTEATNAAKRRRLNVGLTDTTEVGAFERRSIQKTGLSHIVLWVSRVRLLDEKCVRLEREIITYAALLKCHGMEESLLCRLRIDSKVEGLYFWDGPELWRIQDNDQILAAVASLYHDMRPDINAKGIQLFIAENKKIMHLIPEWARGKLQQGISSKAYN